jgi:hypothetical protein
MMKRKNLPNKLRRGITAQRRVRTDIKIEGPPSDQDNLETIPDSPSKKSKNLLGPVRTG